MSATRGPNLQYLRAETKEVIEFINKCQEESPTRKQYKINENQSSWWTSCFPMISLDVLGHLRTLVS